MEEKEGGLCERASAPAPRFELRSHATSATVSSTVVLLDRQTYCTLDIWMATSKIVVPNVVERQISLAALFLVPFRSTALVLVGGTKASRGWFRVRYRYEMHPPTEARKDRDGFKARNVRSHSLCRNISPKCLRSFVV